MDIIEHLTEEHRKVEKLIAELKNSEPGEERYDTFRSLYTALSKHMLVEEQFVYPIIAETLGEDTERNSMGEHEITRSGLASAYEFLQEPGFEAAMDALEAGVNHHVEEEEREIFPRLREHAEETGLDEMDPEDLEGEIWPEAEVEIEALFPAASA